MSLRIRFVGTGGIARHCHLPRLKNLAEVKIGALCDLDETSLRKASNKFGGNAYIDYRRMLKKSPSSRYGSRFRWR